MLDWQAVGLTVGVIMLISMAYAAVSGAPWVPTRRKDIDRILRLADPKAGEIMYDLGCGDGRIIVRAARECGVFGVGIELSLLQALVAKVRSWRSGSNVHIRWTNVFRTDLRNADVVYLFLMPEAYAKIRPKLEAELKSGARVLSYVWPIPGWVPTTVDDREGAAKLYLYVREEK
ncbi:MAG TPA: hypothetical protein VJB99_03420 [Patescibacteria group bacterium]|nr:hypothetical protein [Patescibacteria group bacterium]